MGSGSGAVGRAVASKTRDPRFESSHRQYYLQYQLYLKNCIEKTKIKKKRPGMAQFLKNDVNKYKRGLAGRLT